MPIGGAGPDKPNAVSGIWRRRTAILNVNFRELGVKHFSGESILILQVYQWQLPLDSCQDFYLD
jgi:hypothetical protein